jgi:hypothetical protein
MEPYKIFISYASCDKDIAQLLAARLTDNQFVKWIDDNEVFERGGANFDSCGTR